MNCKECYESDREWKDEFIEEYRIMLKDLQKAQKKCIDKFNKYVFKEQEIANGYLTMANDFMQQIKDINDRIQICKKN